MLSKRISFKTYEECQSSAGKIVKEIKQIQKVFQNTGGSHIGEEDVLDIIVMLSEVLKCEDDMISFDLHRIVEKYPDITEDHLLRLLYLRGDLPKSDLKEKVVYVMKTSKSKTLANRNTIFRQLVFPKLVNLGF